MKIKFKIIFVALILSLTNFSNLNVSATIMGDTNLDNHLDILDILNMKNSLINNFNITNSDFNYNGYTDTQDLLNLKRTVLGIQTSQNVDENLGMYFLTSNLNFREYAGTDYESYDVVDKYTFINVIETIHSSDGNLWGKYEYNGKIGWSSLKYANKLQNIGTTSKGFEIYQSNGLTFIDGIIIVNKTYSLPEDYAPSNGTLTKDTQNAFNIMKSDASKLNLNLYISSGYRSYEYQKSLYQKYVNRDGQAKADTYSARAGHSEHQTGLCFDLNTISDSFANTNEGIWVSKNCYKYGFIIRYPKGKENITGYKYEPWHLRYVGVELATILYENDLTLEEYFGITSKYS